MTMSRIDQLNKQIDENLALTRRIAHMGSVHNTMSAIATLGDFIQQYRTGVMEEIEGLRGDVKSAEAAYENAHAACNLLEDEKDDWLNKKLPGWRKRVSEAERQRDQIGKDLATMTASRDDWKGQALRLEDDLHVKTNHYADLSGRHSQQGDALKAVQRQHEVLSDAYDRQKQLTHDACVAERAATDEIWELKKDIIQKQNRIAELTDPEFAEVEPFRDVMQKTVFFGDADHSRAFSPIAIDPGAPEAITLTPAEIQSGVDRVKWAEGLIKQLPADHDGRNSWLLNYGRS